MKNIIVIIGLVGIVMLSACEGNKKTDGTVDETQADTTAIIGNLNPRGQPDESIPDHSPYSGDTLIHQGPMEKDALPEIIREKIDSDITIKDRKITESRTYRLAEQTLYELTFEGDDHLVVIFDEKGARVIKD